MSIVEFFSWFLEFSYNFVSSHLKSKHPNFLLAPEKIDEDEPMNCYRKAFDIFEMNQDDIFILLTSRLIVHHIEENGTQADEKELHQFRKIFELLINSEELEDLNFDILFENFDHRMSLAKHLAKTMKNLEQNASLTRMKTFNNRLSML